MPDVYRPRELIVPETGAGLRLDHYLSRWYRNWSRTTLVKAIRDGLITDVDGKVLRASSTVRGGQRVLVWIPELAATEAPPDFPEILFEDDRVVALNKPAGMMCHPAGDRFVYALIGLAKERWPHLPVDLVHRIDADTSGIVLLTKDAEANRVLKANLHDPDATKAYLAIVRGRPSWTEHTFSEPIGPALGPVRIQMAVRPDGLPCRTDATVEGAVDGPRGPMTLIRCRIFTGRTHQIRVHLSAAGFPLLGDRLYGGRPELFLEHQEEGLTPRILFEAGAPRHALHSTLLRIGHPDGGTLEVSCPLPPDMERWWKTPSSLLKPVAG
jgi:23S rRNA pseudouridine1911/1915/1917 synthase